IVMSDLEDSTVTYTAVSSPFGGDRAGTTFTRYPDFMPPEDEVFPAEEQPLPAAVSLTADSLGYISDSDPEEDEEDPEEDPEKDPIDYPVNGGDNDDESSNDDEDDDVEEDKDEEEEHLALADSVTPPVHRVTTRMSIREQPPTPFWSEAEIDRLLAIPSPPPSPLSPCPTYLLGFRAAMVWQRAESPSIFHSLSLPPPIILSHTKASMAMMRVAAPSTYILASRTETLPPGTPPLLPIPLPTPSPPLLLPFTDRRAERPEVCLPPQKRLCIALGPRYEVGENSSAPIARPTRGFRVDYGFVATLDKEIRRDPERD
ncbi:hypothetical protein Tco_0022872, partial [Tanacetum coccineum]